MPTFRIELASVPDREYLVAEISLSEELFAELRWDAGRVLVQVFPRASGACWEVSLEELQRILALARDRLGHAA